MQYLLNSLERLPVDFSDVLFFVLKEKIASVTVEPDIAENLRRQEFVCLHKDLEDEESTFNGEKIERDDVFEKAVFIRCAQFFVMSTKLIGFERVLPIRCAPYSKLEYTNHLRF